MTVGDFIEYLKTIPADTEISTLHVYDCGYDVCVEEVDLDVSKNIEFIDMRGNQFVNPTDDIYNKTYLLIGEKWG